MVIEEAAEIIQRIINRDQRSGSLILLLHILCIATHNDADALKDMQIVRLPSVFHQLLLHIPVKGLGFFPRRLVRKDGIGMSRRQLFTVVRRAGWKMTGHPCGVREILSGPCT